MTDNEIMAVLCRPFVNSQNRAETLLGLLVKVRSDELFWRTFSIGWSMCDDTWWWRALLTDTLRNRGSAEPHMRGEDRAFYDSLPDPVTIYRGCSRPKVRGLSWTTDRTVAERFAKGHRGIPVPDPVMATASVPKAAIFTVLTNRQENEVVVNWRRLRRLTVTPF